MIGGSDDVTTKDIQPRRARRARRTVFGFLSFVIVVFFVVAVPRAQTPAPGVIAFTGARVIDGGGGPPLEQATIVVRNGRIEAVGANVAAPAGATVVNLAGKTVIPGLINSHAHIDPDISVRQASYRDEMVQRLKMYAAYGVTSVMTLGFETYDEDDGFFLRDTQRLNIGPVATDAPRLYASGRPVLFRPGPNGSETPDDARIDVQRHVPLRADFIKLHLDGFPVDLKPDVGRRRDRRSAQARDERRRAHRVPQGREAVDRAGRRRDRAQRA
jgi:hypothetical protein